MATRAKVYDIATFDLLRLFEHRDIMAGYADVVNFRDELALSATDEAVAPSRTRHQRTHGVVHSDDMRQASFGLLEFECVGFDVFLRSKYPTLI